MWPKMTGMSDEIAHDPPRRGLVPGRSVAGLLIVALIAVVVPILIWSGHHLHHRATKGAGTPRPFPSPSSGAVLVAQRVRVPIDSGALTGIAFTRSEVWLANWDRGTVSAYSVQTGRLRFTLHVGHGPQTGPESIAAGDSAIWVLDFADSEVLRVDAVSGRVTGRGTLAGLGEPLHLTYAAGAVWVSTDGARFAGDSREHVFKLDPRTLSVVGHKGLPGEGPGATVIPDRRGVWVTCAGDSQLALLSGATLRTLVKTNIPTGQDAAQIDATPSGVWVLSDTDLRRLDPYTGHATTIIPAPSPLSAPAQLTVDAAQRLWLTDGKTVQTFTPATGWRRLADISGIRYLTSDSAAVWIASGNELIAVRA